MRLRSISVCVVALLSILVVAQDCPAETGLCDPDPCQGITNAVAGTCTEVGGSCTGPSDFACSCDSGYVWQGATYTCEEPPPVCADNDQDGYYAIDPINCPEGDDCDDGNADVYPGALELCDGVDNQCPGDVGYGDVDEVCSGCIDDDADGYGNPANPECTHPELDCYDGDYHVNPGATESLIDPVTCYDTLDNDCDELIDLYEPGCASAPCTPGPANTVSGSYGSNSLVGSSIFNELVLLLISIGGVIALRILCSKR